MGTFYALGIVKDFSAKVNQSLGHDEWLNLLNERLDINQYTIVFEDEVMKGSLRKEVFEENIEDFYKKLVVITGENHILNWFENGENDMDQYDNWVTNFEVGSEGIPLNLRAKIAILFLEGKVMVEEFYVEPKLMNWLFRHTDLSNKLAGCVISDIVG